MSRRFLFVLTYVTVVFGLTAFAAPASNPEIPAKPGENEPTNAPTPTGDVGAVADNCAKNYESVTSICNSYLSPSRSGGGSGNSEAGGSALQTIGKINRAVAGGVAESSRLSRSCMSAATACVSACGSNPQRANTCKGLSSEARKRHQNILEEARNDRNNNDKIEDRMAGQKPEGATGSPAIPSLPTASGGSRETSPPPASTSPRFKSQAATATAQAVSTPEQAKQERREKRREERRQEKIDALGKAFMNLNPQQPIGEAIQERPSSASEQRAQKAAANAAAAAGPVAADKSPEEDEEEIGRAGFNKLAEKNLAARKKLAAAIGVNASNLPGASLPPARAASASAGSGFGGSAFGSTGSFNPSVGGASLDPVVKVEPPSDLPQNFRLEAPSAGGGGGGGSSPRMFGRMFSNDRNQDFSPRTRGPAGLEDTEQPQEIRRRNADIWNVISVSFRKHCAMGRLMDCADHLPK